MAKFPDHWRNVALVGVAESAVEAIGRDDRTTGYTRGISAYPTHPGEPHAINPLSVTWSWVALILMIPSVLAAPSVIPRAAESLPGACRMGNLAFRSRAAPAATVRGEPVSRLRRTVSNHNPSALKHPGRSPSHPTPSAASPHPARG